jgi:hypothetical protein
VGRVLANHTIETISAVSRKRVKNTEGYGFSVRSVSRLYNEIKWVALFKKGLAGPK